MLKSLYKLASAAVLLGVTAVSNAALVGAVKPPSAESFDSNILGATLVYDHDFYGASEGRLVMLATGTSLSGAGVPTGGSQPGQSYFGTGDAIRDLVLDVRLNNATGALVSGTVAIPLSNDAGPNDSWTYSGRLTRFGFNNSQLDAFWDVDAYDFSDVVANPNAIVPGSTGIPITCNKGAGLCGWDGRQGGLIILASAAIPQASGQINFGVDWVVASGASNTAGFRNTLGTFDDALASTATFVSTTTRSDVWMTPVPEPEELALTLSGLTVLALMRRRTRQ